MMDFDTLKLSNQFCFPVYATSRLITRIYQPYLDKLGITYPQYLVLMVLWENDGIPVNQIAHKLILNTNTITPLLKRMEKEGLISRERSLDDERKVFINLTGKGSELRSKAVAIPEELAEKVSKGPLSVEQLTGLKKMLNTMIDFLNK